MKSFIPHTAAVALGLAMTLSAPAQQIYEYHASEYVSTDDGRAPQSAFTYDEDANTFTIAGYQGDQNIAFRQDPSTSDKYFIEQDDEWFVVEGTNLRHSSLGNAVIWWFNGYNKGSAAQAHYKVTTGSGSQVFIWNARTDSLLNVNMSYESGRTTLSTNSNSFINALGLTALSGTTSTITNVNYYNIYMLLGKYPEAMTQLGYTAASFTEELRAKLDSLLTVARAIEPVEGSTLATLVAEVTPALAAMDEEGYADCYAYVSTLQRAIKDYATENPTVSYETTATGIVAQYNDQYVRINFFADDIVRVTRSLESDFVRTASMSVVAGQQEAPVFSVSEEDGVVSLQNDVVRVDYVLRTSTLTVTRLSDGEQLIGESQAATFTERADGENQRYTIYSRFELDDEANESIFGMGQIQDGYLNQRGRSDHLEIASLKVVIPYFQSTKNYSFYWDNYSPTDVVDNAQGLHFTSTGQVADYYVLVADDADGVLAAERRLTGHAPMPPLWNFGFYQSRERYESADEVTSIVQKFRYRRIPLDCVVQDWQYWGDNEYWNAMDFLNPNFSNYAEMIDYVHMKNAKLLISVWSNFGPSTDQFAEMQAKGHLLTGDSYPYGIGVRAYDPWSSEARDIYWDYLYKGIVSRGVDALWMDSTEPDYAELNGDSDFDCIVGTGETWRSMRNSFPIAAVGGVHDHYRAAQDEGDEAIGDKRVSILTRSAFLGQQRYGANTWSSDINADWTTFANQIPAALNFSACGIPYWNSDTGGFFNGDTDSEEWRRLFFRWVQFSCFCPMMRVHGSGNKREPWEFGTTSSDDYKLYVQYIRLRYRLVPYLYSTAWQVCNNDRTFMKSLALAFQDDKNGYEVKDQYMFGESFLVSPVLTDEATSRSVYLPAGTPWVNFWTGEQMSGGQTVTADAPTDIIPLFVRAGSIVPWGPDVQYTTQEAWDDLEVRVYPGADGDFTFYEDANDGYGYEQGEYTEIHFHWDDASNQLTISAPEGSYDGMIGDRKFRLVRVSETRGTADGATDDELVSTTVNYTGQAVTVTLTDDTTDGIAAVDGDNATQKARGNVYNLGGQRVANFLSSAFCQAFDNGMYAGNSVTAEVGSNGTLLIGVALDSDAGSGSWAAYDNFELYYLGASTDDGEETEEQTDYTSYIVNNSFETGNMTGWMYGKLDDNEGFVDVGARENSSSVYATSKCDGDYLFNTWNNGDSYKNPGQHEYVTQHISGLPEGEYVLRALIATNNSTAGVDLFANEFVSTVFHTSSSTFKDDSVHFFVNEHQAGVSLGARSAGWFKADNFRIEYLGKTEAYTSHYAERPVILDLQASASADGWTHKTTDTNTNGEFPLTESSGDESGVTASQLQIWAEESLQLGASDTYYTYQNLPAGTYRLSAKVRVIDGNGDFTGTASGLTMYANSVSTPITSGSTITAGSYAGCGFYGEYRVTATVDDSGELRVGFLIDSNCSFNWLSWADVTITYYENQTTYADDALESLDNYEAIAAQAIDRTSYDEAIAAMKAEIAANGVDSDDAVDAYKEKARAAALALVSEDNAANGQFDLTPLFASDAVAVGDWSASLSGLPAGHYTFAAHAFYRPTDKDQALYDYNDGKETILATLSANDASATLQSIHDGGRYRVDEQSGVYSTLSGRGVPETVSRALELFGKGHYWNLVETELATDGELSLSIDYPANAADGAWLVYGSPTLIFGTPQSLSGGWPSMTVPARTDITISKSFAAGTPTAFTAPFELTADDVDGLYAIADISDRKATLLAVSSVAAGTPCYVVFDEAHTSISKENALVLPIVPDSVPLLWGDALYVRGTTSDCGWYYNTSISGGSRSSSTVRTYEILDPTASLDLTENLENINARSFLKVTYTEESSSVISTYNSAPTARRDVPNTVAIPLPDTDAAQVTVTLTADGETFTATTGVHGRLCYVANLVPQTDYAYTVNDGKSDIAQGTIHTTGTLRMIYAPSANNIRDLGGRTTTDGKTVRYGKLYRGSELNGEHVATQTDIDVLLALGIGGEIDFRYDDENDGAGISAFGFSTKAGTYYYASANDWLATQLAESSSQKRWAQEFALVVNSLKDDKAVYFHCVWGADRTGLFALLLEGLMGYTLNDIYHDYELTSYSLAGYRYKSGVQDRLDYFAGLTEEGTLTDDNIKATFREYFVNSLGVSETDIDYFLSEMLEGDDDTTDGISATEGNEDRGTRETSLQGIYNLGGQRVAGSAETLLSLPAGIYIVNGRKVTK